MTILTGGPVAKSPAPAVIEVNEQNFQQEVLERSRAVPVVVDFWAPWCGPCRTLGPMLERLANDARGSWVLAKVNVDENQRLAQAFQVQGIPAVKAVRDGRLVDEFTGALPESQVRAWLKRVVPPTPGQAIEELAALEQRDQRAAEQAYRGILAQDAKNEDARLALGRLLALAGSTEAQEVLHSLASGGAHASRAQAMLTISELIQQLDHDSALDLPAQVEQNAANDEARYQLASHLIAGRRYADAIEQLLAIVTRNRAFRDDGARKLLLALFATLGDSDPLVAPARRRLANLLF